MASRNIDRLNWLNWADDEEILVNREWSEIFDISNSDDDIKSCFNRSNYTLDDLNTAIDVFTKSNIIDVKDLYNIVCYSLKCVNIWLTSSKTDDKNVLFKDYAVLFNNYILDLNHDLTESDINSIVLKTLFFEVLETELSQDPFLSIHLALELWFEKFDESKTDYMCLCEIWKWLQSSADDEVDLFMKLDTLKCQVCRHLSMLWLMWKSLSVLINKQSSLLVRDKARTLITKMFWQYWYDSFDLVQQILSMTKLTCKIHLDMTEYCDDSTELWHFKAWEFSIQTLSEDNIYTQNHNLLISENLIQFKETQHFIKGCVIFIEWDYRQTTTVLRSVLVTVQIITNNSHSYYILNELSDHEENELFLIENLSIELFSRHILNHLDIFLDREYDSNNDNEIVYSDDHFYIWCVINLDQRIIHSLQQMHSICDELKMTYFDWENLCINFTQKSVCSLFMLLFIDDFEIHWNIYWALKIFYWISACLSYSEQHKVVNVFTLSLESYEVSVENIVEVFVKSVQTLNQSCFLSINKVATFVCTFIMILLENLPQQTDNEDFLCYSA